MYFFMVRLFNKKKRFRFSPVAGFSLIEVIIAMFVLVTGVLATITLTINSIKQTGNSRDSLVASALAQEGVELSRSVRDENATQGYYDRSTDLFQYFQEDQLCTIDYQTAFDVRTSGDPFTCGGSVNVNLNLDSDKRYVHSGSNTEFKRAVYFTNFVANDHDPGFLPTKSVDVISMVTWNGKPLPGPTDSCSLANSCIRNESKLTSWILH